MNLKKLLSEDTIIFNLKGNTKEEIIREMVDLLNARGKIKDRDVALRAVLDREQKMSTGMQHGIAIPHGKTDSVDKLVTAMGLKKEGVDFGSMDGKPSTIFIMTISSISRCSRPFFLQCLLYWNFLCHWNRHILRSNHELC